MEFQTFPKLAYRKQFQNPAKLHCVTTATHMPQTQVQKFFQVLLKSSELNNSSVPVLLGEYMKINRSGSTRIERRDDNANNKIISDLKNESEFAASRRLEMRAKLGIWVFGKARGEVTYFRVPRK